VEVEGGESMNEWCLKSSYFWDSVVDFFGGHGKGHWVYFFDIFFNYGILSSLSKLQRKCMCRKKKIKTGN
jgi:hypothetical protein